MRRKIFPSFIYPLTKMKFLRILCWAILPFGVMAQSDDANVVFQSVEERMVYNKSNGLPKYEGIEVEYVFGLTEAVSAAFRSQDELIAFVRPHFVAFIQAALSPNEDKTVELRIRTEGNRLNHDKYNEVLSAFPQYFTKRPRSYRLK